MNSSISAFTNCCGAGIFYYLDEISQNEIKTRIRSAKGCSWGILLAITSSYQLKAKEELTKFGFNPLMEFGNPVHAGRRLTLWALNLNEVTEAQLKLEPEPPKAPVVAPVPPPPLPPIPIQEEEDPFDRDDYPLMVDWERF